jgi:carbamoyl-phosphate synthase large subunit
VIRITRDKYLTAKFLQSIGVPCPKSVLGGEFSPFQFPGKIIGKPRFGSASKGIVTTPQHERFGNDYVVQELLTGVEYTVNVYIDKPGNAHAIIPHQRLEVRAGEVSKARTVDHPKLYECAEMIANFLPIKGPMCFQAIDSGQGTPKVIEINARFGGGYTICHTAGAHFTRYILEQALGHQLSPPPCWNRDLMMLRYDSAVYVKASGT